ncbi:MBL fold metallo-hydrolase [Terriglobus tenax]|uniref:MBL fold metallo-hydrolase n=1 Tax=Terriglobus tenax TaxID=1111115 RepID=UPI0021E07F06|nr:MBL fold metallo-hydrolase [Terriglobus tenax]
MSDLIRAERTLGDFRLTVCTDGTALFDGGAMFGVVPKTLWSRKVQADEQNRIAIGLNCLLVRTGRHNVLIETGFGNKLTSKQREIYGAQQLLPKSLAAAGISPEEIDIVINSHLHWDHCGWNMTGHPDGSVTPTFPNARYFAHRGEVLHGHQQHLRDAVSYVSDNYDPLIKAGQMTLIDKERMAVPEICGGIWVELYPGHTAQTMAIHIESKGEHAVFISDLIPTRHHLDVTWAMGFDLDPIRTIDERKRYFAQALPNHWLTIFPHDHELPMTYLKQDERGRVVPE